MTKRNALVRLTALLVVAVAGCKGSTATGRPYVVQLDRSITASVPADVSATHQAALNLIEKEYLYTVDKQALDAREGIIEATTALGDKVTIKTYSESEKVTRVDIKVGKGDTHRALDILSELEDRLGVKAMPTPKPEK